MYVDSKCPHEHDYLAGPDVAILHAVVLSRAQIQAEIDGRDDRPY